MNVSRMSVWTRCTLDIGGTMFSYNDSGITEVSGLLCRAATVSRSMTRILITTIQLHVQHHLKFRIEQISSDHVIILLP